MPTTSCNMSAPQAPLNAAPLTTSPAPSHDDIDKASVKHLDTAPEHAFEGEDERAVALRLARAADPGPPLFSPRGMQFVLCALVVCACSGDTGFDGTIMGAVNSMDQFHTFFGFDPQTGADKTGIVFVSLVTPRSGGLECGSLCPQTLTPRESTLSVRYARSSPASTSRTILDGGTPCLAPICS